MLDPMLEMRLWVESDDPDYKKAVEERLAELRARGEAAKREPMVSERARRVRLEREWREAEARRVADKRKADRKKRKAEEAELEAIEAAGEVEEAKKFQAKLRARNRLRVGARKSVRAFAVRLEHCEDGEQFKRDLFDGLLSVIPQEKPVPVLRASPPVETGHLADSQIWNGDGWEKD
jgi:hypothetical protein